MQFNERIILKLVSIVMAAMILVSSIALHFISQSWQSIYPVLGEGDIALPVPTVIALLLTKIPSLFALLTIALTLLIASCYWEKLMHHSTLLILLIVLIWFGYFLFINWGLALPFIHIEIAV